MNNEDGPICPDCYQPTYRGPRAKYCRECARERRRQSAARSAAKRKAEWDARPPEFRQVMRLLNRSRRALTEMLNLARTPEEIEELTLWIQPDPEEIEELTLWILEAEAEGADPGEIERLTADLAKAEKGTIGKLKEIGEMLTEITTRYAAAEVIAEPEEEDQP